MSKYSTAKARKEFSEVINRIAYGKERIILTRRGKPVVAIVPIEDSEFLEELEDRIDLEDARKALKTEGRIPWEVIKKERHR